MAKPIRATPELHGKEALRFIERMHEVETKPMTALDRRIRNRVKSKTKFFKSFFG